MKQLNLFIELTRLKKPIGFMLLFWPCAWGLTLAYDFSNDLNYYFFYLTLFFLGSVLMRSAGCIVNDILDKEFDKKVSRTKNRPIASGKISIKLGLTYVIFLCFIALLVLLNFNTYTVMLALGSMPLAFSYPLMKRYTYWPQLFLIICYLVFIISLIGVGLLMKFNTMFYIFILVPFFHLFFYQIYNFDFKDSKSSLKVFKSNNLLGVIILFNILIGKV